MSLTGASMHHSQTNIGSMGKSPQQQQQQTTATPSTTQVPDVDLSGLTEEEKQMIQSVMARAQQDTIRSSPMPSATGTPMSSTPAKTNIIGTIPSGTPGAAAANATINALTNPASAMSSLASK